MPEPLSSYPRTWAGGLQIQAADLWPNGVWRADSYQMGTIPTTGAATPLLFYPPAKGSMNTCLVASISGSVQSDTNFITFTCTNLTTGHVMATMTTKVTGGEAIPTLGTATFAPSGTPAFLLCGATDLIEVTAVVTGTLGAAVTGVVIGAFFFVS